MVTAPLGKIDNFRYLKQSDKGHTALLKPAGLDVFVYGGRLFDFFNREITNKDVTDITFKQILDISQRTGGCFHGVLLKKNSNIEVFYPVLYSSRGVISELELHIYDVAFPHFNTDEMQYWTRYDILVSLIGKDKVNNCFVVTSFPIKTSRDLNQLVMNNFIYPKINSLLLYDLEGRYMPGLRQLAFSSAEKVLFELKANQRCRAHVNKIIPLTIRDKESTEIKIADSVLGRHKGEIIEIPILKSIDIRSSLWTYRKELKNQPFWFNCVFISNDSGKQDPINIHFDRLIL